MAADLSNPSHSEPLLDRYRARLRRRLQAARRRSEGFVRVRTAVFFVGLGAAFLAEEAGHAAAVPLILVPFGALFLGLVVVHGRLKQGSARFARWIAIKDTHRARQRLDWNALPAPRDYAQPADHPFAGDLDLVGRHSLLRLLDTTVSTRGRALLAEWLLAPPPSPEAVAARQRLVRELVQRPLLRDRVILAADAAPDAVESETIAHALAGSAAPRLAPWLALQSILAGLTALGVVWEFGFGGPRLWSYTLLAYALLYLLLSGSIAPIFGAALELNTQLERLWRVLRRLESRRDAGAAELTALCAPFRSPAARPSQHLRRLSRIVSALSVKAHPLVHLGVNILGPWDLYFAHRYTAARRAIAASVPAWLEALAQFEAAAALARFSDLNPGYPFPEILPAAAVPKLAAEALGHPLIPHDRRVLNDFSLAGRGAIGLVTGSNMSGKSTFLRTIGINACLALAGAPVCARSFALPPVQVWCSVRIQDDLEEGLSYFYAEVRRLRRILDAASIGITATPGVSPGVAEGFEGAGGSRGAGRGGAAAPNVHPAAAEGPRSNVLFLIDEIFKGTNNRERLIGSEAYLRALTHGDGFGLVTTHDLELTALAAANPTIVNLHFQETITAGRLTFDYRLRPGPCPTTNALRIMALEGLPVPLPES